MIDANLLLRAISSVLQGTRHYAGIEDQHVESVVRLGKHILGGLSNVLNRVQAHLDRLWPSLLLG